MSIVPLFWTSEYSRIHGDDHQLIETVSGLLSVGRAGSEILKSPGRATFGGFWIEPNSVFTYTEKTIQQLKNYSKMSSQIRISFPPEHFHPEVFQEQISFFTKNCSALIPESNFHIMVHNRNDVSKGNRKRQRQFIERGGSVSQVEKPDWHSIYKLLVENRLRRGVELSMPWHIFERGLIDRPDAFTIWGATLGSEFVGGALTVEVDSNTLYVLFWGDTLLGRDISVVGSICEKLIEFCTSRNYQVLDLGISSVDGLLDESLANFKVNLGAVQTIKPILTVKFP
jgi:hypothetical protein